MRRRSILLMFLVMSFLLPVTVKAQQTYTLQLAYVSVWPEYEYSVDKPGQINVLVINRFLLDPQDASIKYPTKINVQIPATALKPSVVAVGQTADTVSDQNVEFTTSAPDHGWINVLITTSGPAIQLEYYDYNISKTGSAREYTYVWPGTYAVGTFHLDVREPMHSMNMTSVPDAQNSGTDADGFKFGEMTMPNMPAGKPFTLKINYQRDTDAPSTSFMPVQPSAPLDQPVNGQFSLSVFMPWIVGGLLLLVVVSGITWFRLSTRREKGLAKLQKRHVGRKPKKGKPEGDLQIYCHECGKRAQPGDTFCRTCGTRLRQIEA